MKNEPFRQVLEAMPVGAGVLRGAELAFEFANERLVKMLSLPRLEGVTLGSVLPEDLNSAIFDAVRQSMESGAKVVLTEVGLQIPGGKAGLYAQISLQPLGSEVLFSAVDISDFVQQRRTLEAQVELLTTVTNRTPAHMTYMDKEGRFRYVNESFAQWFRRTPQEIVGKKLSDIVFDQEAFANSLPFIKRALAGEALVYDLTVTRSEIPAVVRIAYTPDRDPRTGDIRGFVSISQIVTELKRALAEKQANEELYRSLTDTIPQLMWTSLPDGRINYVNQRCATYTGLETAEKIGDGWVDSIHPEDRERVFAAWMQSATTGLRFRQDYRIRGADGSYRWFSGQGVPVRNAEGVIQYWIGTASDIEEDKKISQELKAAKEAAEKANAAKSAFLANMSHEIRTPLGAVVGFSALLKEKDLSAADRKSYVEIIERNGKWLTQIIDDILDLAKVETGLIEIEQTEVAVRELVKEVIEIFSEQARRKNLELSFHPDSQFPAGIYTDPVRLRQILINLIGNAVKFTDRGSVKIRASCEGLRIRFEIKDTGCGLSDEQCERLFKPFSQADSTTTRKFGGTGLGLALSKRLAEAMGGQIRIAEYGLNQGCTFVLEILARNAEPVRKTPKTKKPSPKSPLSGLEILVVDDSADIRRLLKDILAAQGARVEIAEGGAEALRKIKERSVHLILLDIQMPGMDGFQVLSSMREEGHRTPVIAVTAHAMLEEKQRTSEAGFVAHLSKPFDIPQLLEAVSRFHVNA